MSVNKFDMSTNNLHCAKCGRELQNGDIVYKLVRGTYGAFYGYIPDWTDYDPFAGFVFICETCSGFKGEWK